MVQGMEMSPVSLYHFHQVSKIIDYKIVHSKMSVIVVSPCMYIVGVPNN